MRVLTKLKWTSYGIYRELRAARWEIADWHRYAVDVLAYRVLALWPTMPTAGRERCIRIDHDTVVTYRRNRGDIQGIREVFLDRVYELPHGIRPKTLIDLGANIGLVSVRYAKEYGLEKVIAVEPVPANAELARRNLRNNRVPGEMLQAAVGPRRGKTLFIAEVASNLGRVGDGSLEVDMVTMDDVFDRLGEDEVDVLKMDIEGGEEDLLRGELGWLRRVRVLFAELHPELVEDRMELVRKIVDQGLAHHPTSGDLFISE